MDLVSPRGVKPKTLVFIIAESKRSLSRLVQALLKENSVLQSFLEMILPTFPPPCFSPSLFPFSPRPAPHLPVFLIPLPSSLPPNIGALTPWQAVCWILNPAAGMETEVLMDLTVKHLKVCKQCLLNTSSHSIQDAHYLRRQSILWVHFPLFKPNSASTGRCSDL